MEKLTGPTGMQVRAWRMVKKSVYPCLRYLALLSRRPLSVAHRLRELATKIRS